MGGGTRTPRPGTRAPRLAGGLYHVTAYNIPANGRILKAIRLLDS
jgi:hypothetical protein